MLKSGDGSGPCDGERIGKLEEVYVDVESDEPMFGTFKEGFIGPPEFVPPRGQSPVPEIHP
jgi:hypothetical protein